AVELVTLEAAGVQARDEGAGIDAVVVGVAPPAVDVAAIAPMRVFGEAGELLHVVFVDPAADHAGGDGDRRELAAEVALLDVGHRLQPRTARARPIDGARRRRLVRDHRHVAAQAEQGRSATAAGATDPDGAPPDVGAVDRDLEPGLFGRRAAR